MRGLSVKVAQLVIISTSCTRMCGRSTSLWGGGRFVFHILLLSMLVPLAYNVKHDLPNQCPVPPKSSEYNFPPLRLKQEENGATSGRVWEAGIILAYALKHKTFTDVDSVNNVSSIVELGSGTGLLGLVAAIYSGATKVILTDLETALLRDNVNANAHFIPRFAHVQVSKLTWGMAHEINALGTFDLIIGADVVYSGYELEPLVSTVFQLSSRALDIVWLLSYTERDPQVTKALERELMLHGLVFDVHPAVIWNDMDEYRYADWLQRILLAENGASLQNASMNLSAEELLGIPDVMLERSIVYVIRHKANGSANTPSRPRQV